MKTLKSLCFILALGVIFSAWWTAEAAALSLTLLDPGNNVPTHVGLNEDLAFTISVRHDGTEAVAKGFYVLVALTSQRNENDVKELYVARTDLTVNPGATELMPRIVSSGCTVYGVSVDASLR